MVNRLAIALCLGAAAFIGGALAGESPLGIRVGKTALKRIVVAEDAAPTAKLAAGNLQDFVERVSGDRLEIVGSTDEASGSIFVGEREELVRDVGSEGYRILAKDGNVYITGRDSKEVVYGIRNPWNRYEVYNEELQLGAFGEAGTLYGVNSFLEKYAGVRFYCPGELGTVVPRKSIGIPEKLDEGNSPKFLQRHIWICNFNTSPENALWYRRIGLGAKAPVQIIDYNYFFTGKFEKTHPEYLALVDGVRDSGNKCASRGGGHLCYTAPGCKEAVAELIKDFFRSHPEHAYFPLVPGDGFLRTCECENCLKQYDINAPKSDPGRFSFHVWNFVNEVARLVADEFPDKYVGCLAYGSHLLPPKEIEKLNPNVAVMFCKNRSTMASPAYAKKMHERIEGWKGKVSNCMFAWDYYLHCWKPWAEMPVFFMHTIQKDIRYEVKNGFGGEFIEAESWNDAGKAYISYPATQHLNLYVTGKLYWNPSLDLDALLKEYYELYYGPAKAPMRAFYETAEKYWNAANAKNRKTTGILAAVELKDVFDMKKMARLQGYLDKALALAPEGSQYRARVEQMANEIATGAKVVQAMSVKSPEEKALFTSEAVSVDGRLDEKTWNDGAVMEMVRKDGLETPYKTKVMARHDGKKLYLGFILTEKKMDKLKIKGRVRDFGDMWLDDCVEFYIMKNSEDMCGRQFVVNAGGYFWDASINGNTSRDTSWNCDGESAASIDGDKLYIEMSIPLAALELAPGSRVPVNFFRSRVVDEGQDFACWSPIFTHAHLSPKYFGWLTLEK